MAAKKRAKGRIERNKVVEQFTNATSLTVQQYYKINSYMENQTVESVWLETKSFCDMGRTVMEWMKKLCILPASNG